MAEGPLSAQIVLSRLALVPLAVGAPIALTLARTAVDGMVEAEEILRSGMRHRALPATEATAVMTALAPGKAESM